MDPEEFRIFESDILEPRSSHLHHTEIAVPEFTIRKLYLRNIRFREITMYENTLFVFSFRKRILSVVLLRDGLIFEIGIRHMIILEYFFPPLFLLESGSLHEKESEKSIDDPHECPNEDITRIVHAIMYP